MCNTWRSYCMKPMINQGTACEAIGVEVVMSVLDNFLVFKSNINIILEPNLN